MTLEPGGPPRRPQPLADLHGRVPGDLGEPVIRRGDEHGGYCASGERHDFPDDGRSRRGVDPAGRSPHNQDGDDRQHRQEGPDVERPVHPEGEGHDSGGPEQEEHPIGGAFPDGLGDHQPEDARADRCQRSHLEQVSPPGRSSLLEGHGVEPPTPCSPRGQEDSQRGPPGQGSPAPEPRGVPERDEERPPGERQSGGDLSRDGGSRLLVEADRVPGGPQEETMTVELARDQLVPHDHGNRQRQPREPGAGPAAGDDPVRREQGHETDTDVLGEEGHGGQRCTPGQRPVPTGANAAYPEHGRPGPRAEVGHVAHEGGARHEERRGRGGHQQRLRGVCTQLPGQEPGPRQRSERPRQHREVKRDLGPPEDRGPGRQPVGDERWVLHHLRKRCHRTEPVGREAIEVQGV